MVYKKNLPPQLQNYEMVEDRLVRFWKHCPNGRLETEVVQIFDNGDRVLMKATMWIDRDDSHPVATGIAMDWKNKKGMVNSTNWIENTETSCLGRCISSSPFATEQTTARWLGQKEEEVQKLGKAPRPSREEMEIALGRQEQLKEQKKKPTPKKKVEREITQTSVPLSDLKEVAFRNFCEELVKKGEMDTKFKERFFEYIDQDIQSAGLKGLELAIDECNEMEFNFTYNEPKPVVKNPVTEPVEEFDTIEQFVEYQELKHNQEMIRLNPQLKEDDERLVLQASYIIKTTLKEGRQDYQKGVDYWNKWFKQKPRKIEEQEIPTPIEGGHLDITDLDVVQPEDLPSIMEEIGATEVDKFEEFPTLVKKNTYKNPNYKSSVKQQELILKCCKFRNITKERLEKYLKQEFNTSLSELSIQKASWLIDGFFNEKKY